MANKSLFSSLTAWLPRAETTNEAGGRAYRLTPKHALAQLTATGCFNGTFYAQAGAQLDELTKLTAEVDDNVFLAKLALYARERALMKDMPVALTVILSKRDPALFRKVFERVVDNGRTLRTFLQMVRSGRFGRKSLSYALQRAVQRWLNTASVEKLLSASIGRDPSLRDVLRLARPTPTDDARRALFGRFAEQPVEKWAPATEADLPAEVRALDAYRRATTPAEQIALLTTFRARWDLLSDKALSAEVWGAIARQMGPQALRMNLNTLARHEVFKTAEGPALVEYIASRLTDADDIRRSRQFPYQFFTAYLNAGSEVPRELKSALHRAAEVACGNVPEFAGPVVVGLDVSGSMSSAITGDRGRGGTSKMRCVDVAALFAAAILRRNPDSLIVPFDTEAYPTNLDPGDTILSLAERLAKYGGGGTNCALPLAYANQAHRERKFAGCVLVSDQESWIGTGRANSTGLMTAWQEFVKNQVRLHGKSYAGPKLVCLDLQPYTTTQAPERSDILNVGGFSDAVFSVVAAFLAGDATRFVGEVESMTL
jgi:60 kDa SS-A/Ro ribonucleoprotein